MTQPISFLRPHPPKLSEHLEQLREIEASGLFSNYGPVNTRLEDAMLSKVFGGQGACVTVCNATIGLMLAILVVTEGRKPARKYALMPSFTFAATAHAAIWCGLTPYFYDIDPDSWTPSGAAETALVEKLGDEVAVIVPYATFGANLDLAHYERLSQTYGVPVVVDAAASLGSVDDAGLGFGAGFSGPLVYSMHATKTFSTLEGGLIYADDQALVARLRTMGNFGFGEPRIATMPGLNSKLNEVCALVALAKLQELPGLVAWRATLAQAYREQLPDWRFQRATGRVQAHQFMPLMPPEGCDISRQDILRGLTEEKIGAASYFSPHLANHPYFHDRCGRDDLAVSDQLSDRILSLPLADEMTIQEVLHVASVLKSIVNA